MTGSVNRRKFLRAADTELGHVRAAFIRLALSRPSVHLTLMSNGRSLYEVPASFSLP